jgi:HEPN domain-containing protein
MSEFNVEKHVAHWSNGALEDLQIARELIANDRRRYGLFFAHLALEKMLKAHVCKMTRDHPPRIHNLRHLSEMSGLAISPQQENLLSKMNEFQRQGRYPDMMYEVPIVERTQAYLRSTEEMVEWLRQQL